MPTQSKRFGFRQAEFALSTRCVAPRVSSPEADLTEEVKAFATVGSLCSTTARQARNTKPN